MTRWATALLAAATIALAGCATPLTGGHNAMTPHNWRPAPDDPPPTCKNEDGET